MKKLFLPILIVSVAAVISFFVFRSGKSSANLDEFARCLAEKGVAMYGAYWCSHCQNEKEAFGDSFKYINYIECTEKPQECLAKGVEGYPTWIFPDGRKLEGEQGIENLSRESGCRAVSRKTKENFSKKLKTANSKSRKTIPDSF